MTLAVRTGLEVPLRDGCLLRGTSYGASSTPQPVVLAITPYGVDRSHPRGMTFGRRGFVFVALDSRGRGDSDGTFIPFETDGPDGFDAVEWLAGQSWCDGRVVMWGGSYCGFLQWATAAQAPPHLVAIAPVASVGPGIDVPIYRNITAPFML